MSKYVTDAAREYAKKLSKDDALPDAKYRVIEIFDYINDELRHGAYQFNDSNIGDITASYTSLFATFNITIQNVTIYYADNKKSNNVRFAFTVKLTEDATIENIHVYSFDAFVGKTILGHLHHFNDTTLSKIFGQIDAFITTTSRQTQSQAQEKNITDAAREYAKMKAKDSDDRFFELLAKNQRRSKSEQHEFKRLFRPLSFDELITKGKMIFNEVMSNDVGGHDLPLRQLFNAGQSNKLSSSDYKLIDNAFNNGMTFNEIINQFDRLAKDKWEFNPNMYEGLNVNQSPFSADAIAKIKNILKKGYNVYRQFKVH